MYQLTIDRPAGRTISEHPDFDSAHRRLIDYVVTADYYLQRIPASSPHTRYALLDLGDSGGDDQPSAGGQQPASVGHAAIERLPDTIAAGYYAAVAALRWIADHHQLWSHGADTDPGGGYPLAILTAARAEARCWFAAGTLLGEAARLAGVDPIAGPDQRGLDALRRSAIRGDVTGDTGGSPAALAAAVHDAIPSGTPRAHTAALIWWFALLGWGVRAP